MPRLSLRLTAIASAVLTFFAIIFFLMFAPPQLGGSVTYVVVDGNSMAPDFHLGDLLLVREKQAYSVGDAVVYQNAEMGSYVFHRIVGTDLGRYVLKGDNNSWLDSYLPVHDEIVGELWFHIPKLGLAIEWMRAPLYISRFIFLLGFVLSALGLVYFGVNIYRKASQSQGALIRLKHGSLLMDVNEQYPLPSGQVMDVAAMDDLVRLAERHDTMILHMQRNFLHYYFVQSNGASYRYVITTGKKGIPSIDLPANESLEKTQPAPISPEVVFMPIPLPPHWEALIQQSTSQTETDITPHPEVEIPPSIPEHEPAEIPAPPDEVVEYVIRTGAIECETSQIETTVLRKIKL